MSTPVETAASIRALKPVAAFDSTDRLAEYGLTVASSKSFAAARDVVKSAVDEAVARINAYFVAMKEIDQNPYRDVVHLAGKSVRFAAPIQLFEAEALKRSVERAFVALEGNAPALERPNLEVLATKIIGEIDKVMRDREFELAVSERHADGSLSRMAIRDPVYVADAEKAPSKSGGIDMATFDADLRSKSAGAHVPSAEEMGVRSVARPELFTELQAFIDQVADEAFAKVAGHMRSMVAIGHTPFGNRTHWIARHSAHVVDRERLRMDDYNWECPRAALVPVSSVEEILERLTKRFRTEVAVDAETFTRHISIRIGQRLNTEPGLCAALVAVREEEVSDKRGTFLVVVCVPEKHQRDPDKLPRWKRPFAFLMRKPKPVALLPAPPAHAVPPVALPGATSSTVSPISPDDGERSQRP